MAKPLQIKDIPLNGKVITSRDSATIGANFQQLTNMEYTDTHPKGIAGMSEINATALTNTKIRSGFHYRKEQPAESHVLVQSFDVTLNQVDANTIVLLDCNGADGGTVFTNTGVITNGTASGNANTDDAQQKFGTTSMGLDGTGDYVSISDSERLNFGLSPFTVDFWVRFAALPSSGQGFGFFSQRDGADDYLKGFIYNAGTSYHLQLVTEDDGSIGTIGGLVIPTDPVADTWYHVAYISGWGGVEGVVAGCWNGTVIGSGTWLGNGWPDLSGDLDIGRHYDEGDTAYEYLNGWIDEFRVSSATRWTANFTPPTIAYGASVPVIYDNGAIIPATGNFNGTAVLTSTSDADIARFSTAPNNNMAMCDKSGAYVWGGDEKLCSAFITSTAAVTDTITNPKDYTEEVTNTLSTASEVALIGGGNDAETVLLMHFDGTDAEATTMPDSSVGGAQGNADDITADAQYDTAQSKFGVSSLLLDGTGDSIGFDDSADWDFDSDNFTIDFWFRESPSAGGTHDGFYTQYEDDDNFITLRRVALDEVSFLVQVADSNIIYKSFTLPVTPVVNTWYHLALIRGWGGDADTYALTLDGVLVDTYENATDMPNLAGGIGIGGPVGAQDLQSFHGWLDEFRITKGVARWTANFTPPVRAYSVASTNWLVGATRPLKGVKFYVGDANSQASTMTTQEWNGSSWTTLTSAVNTWVDNTDTGASLAQTGTVTWDTTESTSKIKYLNGLALYWYQFAIDAGDATIYHCTVDAAMQPVKDIWDGVDRSITSFQVYDATAVAYADDTLKVYSDDYEDLNKGTYSKVVTLASGTEWILAGFSRRMMGVSINIVTVDGVIKGNVDAATVTVSYWNGAAWSELSGVSDGTSRDSKTLAESGVISWQPPEKGEEFKQEISNYPAFYHYKLSFSANLSADVQIYYVTGIPAQKTINSYSFPLHAMNSLWLCSEQDGDKNKMIRSLAGTSSTYNGMGYEEFELGDETELMAGAVIYAQFNSNLYEMIVVCKKSKTYILVPLADGVREFEVADHIGCVAPGTMKSLNMGDTEEGNRNVCIWQGAEGIYAFEGRSPVRISDDIQDIFDKNNSSGMNRSYPHVSYGFFDIENYCYHWVYASGTATIPDDEWVYDIKRKRWFQIDRGAGNDLMGGVEVESTLGVPYSYGFDNSGQVYRLNNGTDFDGADIVHTIHTGDFPMEPTVMVETKLRKINLVCGATNTTSSTITASLYRDGSSTANTDTATLVPQASGKTIAQTKTNIHSDAVFHSVKMVMTTDDETVGFEPMYLGLSYRPIRKV